jgi:hypothetical protein
MNALIGARANVASQNTTKRADFSPLIGASR